MLTTLLLTHAHILKAAWTIFFRIQYWSGENYDLNSKSITGNSTQCEIIDLMIF